MLERTYAWAPDSQRIAYVGSDAQGASVPKVWNLADRSVEAPPLAGALARHGLTGTFWNAPSWSPDGATLGIQASRPGGEAEQAQVLLQTAGAVRALPPVRLPAPIPGSRVGAPLGWLPSGDAVLLEVIDQELGSVLVQRLSDGQWRPWLPGDGPHTFSERRFGRVAYATPLGQWEGAAWQVWLADFDGANPTPLARWLPPEGEPYPSPAFAFVPGQALLAVSDRQGVKLLGFDGSTQGTIVIPGSVSSVSWLTSV
jgi:hypothetical protein